jgi:hypothetical protein
MSCLQCGKKIRWWQRRLVYPNGEVIHTYPCMFIFIRERTVVRLEELLQQRAEAPGER